MAKLNSAVPSTIPFSKPYRASDEMANLEKVLASDHVHGDGPFTERATAQLQMLTGANHILLTTSGTHALDMIAHLLQLGPKDEVIVPSFTFSSGATSIALCGATPVFVGLDPRTGNIDPAQIPAAITPHTKAISIMHYGGVPADFEAIAQIAREHEIPIIEDNAHGLGVVHNGRVLGTQGVLGIQSFHDTKNVHSGEGGALLINDEQYALPAEILREKGTNRSQFLRGQVDKYTWVGQGSSYLPSELNAAVLSAQLDEFKTIQRLRTEIWQRYQAELTDWARDNKVVLMDPPGGIHASHVFYMHMPTWDDQTRIIAHLKNEGVIATFHYVPLHSSPAGKKFGRTVGELAEVEDFSRRLVRLPLWAGMTHDDVTRVINSVKGYRT